jgi:hypothetical protein
VPLSDRRQQILLEIQAQGGDVPARVAQEMQRLKDMVGTLEMQFADGSLTNSEYVKGIQGIAGGLASLSRFLEESTAAAYQADEGFAAMQARLREMGEQDARSAVEAIALRRQATDEAVAQHQRSVEAAEVQARIEAELNDAEVRAYRAAFQAMGERDARAADSAAEATRLARERGETLVREGQREIQNEREIAAAQASLNNQRKDALAEIARIEANRAATASNRDFDREAQKQLDALRQVATQTQSNVDLYGHLQEELADFHEALIRGQMVNSDRLEYVKAKLASLKEEIDGVGVVSVKTAKDTNDFNQVINSGASYAQHSQGMFSKLTAGLFSTSDAARDTGYKILHVAHAFQDMQYGFGAVLNNIPLVVQAFGGTAGLAGAVMVLGVTMDTLYNNRGKIISFFGDLTEKAADLRGSLERLEERIKELDGKKIKLAVDVLELENAKREVKEIRDALAEVERLRKSQGYYAKQSGSAIEDIIAESTDEKGKAIGSAEVERRLRVDMVRELSATSGPLAEASKKSAEAAQHLKELQDLQEKNPALKGISSMIVEAGKTLEKANERERFARTEIDKEGGGADIQLGKILKDAKTGSGAEQRAAQQKLAERLARVGLGDLAKGVQAATPENIQEMDEAEEEAERSVGRMKETRVDNKKKRDKFMKDLNQEAKGNLEIFEERKRLADKQAIEDRKHAAEAKALSDQGARNQITGEEKAERERDKEAKATAKGEAKDVAAQAKVLAKTPLGPQVESLIFEAAQAGATEDQAGDYAKGMVQRHLRQGGMPAEQAGAVAGELVSSEMGKFQNHLMMAQQMTGNNQMATIQVINGMIMDQARIIQQQNAIKAGLLNVQAQQGKMRTQRPFFGKTIP